MAQTHRKGLFQNSKIMSKKKTVDISIFDDITPDPDEERSGKTAVELMRELAGPTIAMDAFKKLTDFSGPDIHARIIPKIQMEKVHDYASARVLLKSLNRYYKDWSAKIENDHQIAIYVILANGAIIRVHRLIEEGFNGIAIEGDIDGAPCLLLLQQSSLQFMCVAEKLEPNQSRKNIGFIFAETKA